MTLTKNWIKTQIDIYSKMLLELTNDESDKTLKTIWGERINTLESTLKVINLEMRV
jgi:hypothetical protein